MRPVRIVLPLTFCCVSGLAAAQLNFNNVSASYTLDPGAVTRNWIVTPDGLSGSIDFTQNAPAFKVGGATTFSTGRSGITYDVTSPNPISGFDIVLQGDVEDFGHVHFTAGATSGGSLGSIAADISGGSAGGTNGAFTNVYHVSFNTAVTSFSVSESLSSDIGGQGLPSTSIALIGTVENNFPVPEPASMTALGLGGLALVRRGRFGKP